jgi:hypothetical protein
MKTTMKQLAAGTFIALLLLVGNVNAEGTETKASGHEAIEATLQLEKWMIDETIWNTNSVGVTFFARETEPAMEIENWMTSERTWSLSHNLIEETEKPMELECWMSCEEIWNKDNNVQEKESVLNVENWMTSENIWGR